MELQNFEPRFMEIEERMTERSQEINNYKESMNEVSCGGCDVIVNHINKQSIFAIVSMLEATNIS